MAQLAQQAKARTMVFDQDIVTRAITVGVIASFIISRIIANAIVKRAKGPTSNWIMVLASNRAKKKAIKNWGESVGRPSWNISEARKIWMGTVAVDGVNPGHPVAHLVDRDISEYKQGAWPR